MNTSALSLNNPEHSSGAASQLAALRLLGIAHGYSIVAVPCRLSAASLSVPTFVT